MLYLVSYDIPSDKAVNRRRNKLAKFLEGRGLRVQLSVFELMLSPERLPALLAELNTKINPKEDSIRVYPLCGSCIDRVNHLGREALIESSGLLVW